MVKCSILYNDNLALYIANCADLYESIGNYIITQIKYEPKY